MPSLLPKLLVVFASVRPVVTEEEVKQLCHDASDMLADDKQVRFVCQVVTKAKTDTKALVDFCANNGGTHWPDYIPLAQSGFNQESCEIILSVNGKTYEELEKGCSDIGMNSNTNAIYDAEFDTCGEAREKIGQDPTYFCEKLHSCGFKDWLEQEEKIELGRWARQFKDAAKACCDETIDAVSQLMRATPICMAELDDVAQASFECQEDDKDEGDKDEDDKDDKDDHKGDYKCVDVKKMFQDNGCCGNPDGEFKFSRRLTGVNMPKRKLREAQLAQMAAYIKKAASTPEMVRKWRSEIHV